ncbi:MAG: hypothetical protein Q9O24_00765 [Gammaproteobacteria bacterium]|nr:hypothetical protein [Gammaproteobacteria bacterium]
MNELESIFERCDALFVGAELDYNDLKQMKMTPEFFNDYRNTRIVNSFLFNFAKLQDALGAKLFRKLLYELKEIDTLNMPMIDVLNILEKRGIVEDVSTWDELREIRNVLAHEYPFDLAERIANIQLAFKGYEILKTIYAQLKSFR